MNIATHEKKLIELISTKIKILNDIDVDSEAFKRKYGELKGLMIALTNTKTSNRDYFISEKVTANVKQYEFVYYNENGRREIIY